VTILVPARALYLLLAWWLVSDGGPAFGFYGDIRMNTTAKEFGAPAVIFPHWIHRTEFMCSACHPDVFPMAANSQRIMMERMAAKQNFCSTCHNGTVAWRPVSCTRCHRVDDRLIAPSDPSATTLPEPGPPYAEDNRDPEVLLQPFPRDEDGGVDWIAAVKTGLIRPRPSYTLNESSGPPEPGPADSILSETDSMPPVIFPHASHALWLECRNCHPGVFAPKNGANAMSMADLNAGRFCGTCHGKVAFPLSSCDRCHRR
jgi:c(7)-type cytochrome triheme protein